MSGGYAKETEFKTYWHHRKPGYWLRKDRARAPGVRERPEVLRLEVAPGVTPNGKPPVRIFVGTEAAQARAERVFVWSVMQARDPARAYEIHLMKDLEGYDRQGWKTGFTNYRYAIPSLAGGQGRAIYNDVDQIYLADPGELFDLDMGDAGVMSITERDNSVMLLDCARMDGLWRVAHAKAGARHRHFLDSLHGHELWRRLGGEWNARDGEFRLGRSKCFHFTTLQTQPWRPFPDQIRYRPHPDGEVWFRLERAADEAGFTVFTKARPSRRFGELLEQYRLLHRQGESQLGLAAEQTFDGGSLAKHEADIAGLARRSGARTILDYGAGKGGGYAPAPGEPAASRLKRHPAWPGVAVTCYDPGYPPFAAAPGGGFDGVICIDVLEHLPDEDVPWVLDELFAAAERFVYAVAACYPARKHLPNGENAHATQQAPEWWRGQLEAAARRRPGVAWNLVAVQRSGLGKRRRRFGGGGGLARAA